MQKQNIDTENYCFSALLKLSVQNEIKSNETQNYIVFYFEVKNKNKLYIYIYKIPYPKAN